MQSLEDTPRRRAALRDPLIGTWLDGRYLIEARIATGGFGAIYRARAAGGMAVALKVLHPKLARDASMVARFRREGATLTQLYDPHTVTTLAVGETDDGTLYIAMELLTGESLQARLERERALAWPAAVAIARAVCSSLAEAHALGVVHRDLKPANIHVEPRGGAELVKVIDFGIVKIAPGSAIDDGCELTFAGHTIGTCDYMSPEQIVGGTCEAPSDIYSLGVVLYEMLTGRRPFARLTSPTATMTALLTLTPQPPSLFAAVPPALDRIVMRCLAREPHQRFARATDLAAALDRLRALIPGALDDITEAHPVVLRIDAIASDEAALYEGHEAHEVHEVHDVAPIDDSAADGADRTFDDSACPWLRAMTDAEAALFACGTGRVARGSTRDVRPADPRRSDPGFATLPGVAVATIQSAPMPTPLPTPSPIQSAPTPTPRPSTPILPPPRISAAAVPLPRPAATRRRRAPWHHHLAAAALLITAAVAAGLAAYFLAASL